MSINLTIVSITELQHLERKLRQDDYAMSVMHFLNGRPFYTLKRALQVHGKTLRAEGASIYEVRTEWGQKIPKLC